MKVLICGAGIGGLVLAHALLDVVDIEVLERDRAPEATGGYRISLDHEACQVLDRHLDAVLLRHLRAISDTGDRFEHFTIADARLRPIVIAREDRTQDRILAQRRALRTLLSRDLAGRISFGSAVAAVEPDGSRVRLTDGSVVGADLVVAADGAGSAVMSSILGHSPDRDLGLTGIAGTTPLHGIDLPAYLRHGPALAFGSDGTALFLSTTHPPAPTPADSPVPGLPSAPSLIWGVITRSDRLPATRGRGAPALIGDATRLLDGWRPDLVAALADSPPSGTAAFPFRAIDPAGAVRAVHRGVVGLGDAVHAMPPTGGRGASTAIADAGDLADAIIEHLRDRTPLAAALERYQRLLIPRARSAVRESLGPVRIINALQHRPIRAAAGPLLRAAGRLGALRYGERP